MDNIRTDQFLPLINTDLLEDDIEQGNVRPVRQQYHFDDTGFLVGVTVVYALSIAVIMASFAGYRCGE